MQAAALCRISLHFASLAPLFAPPAPGLLCRNSHKQAKLAGQLQAASTSAGAIAVAPETRLVITEGNYLLLGQGHWNEIVPLLDEAWYVEVDDGLRRQRLQRRHMRFGRSAEAALAWIEGTDEPNARLIEATRQRAHAVWRLD